MSYSDFLNTLVAPIQSFISWATTLTNNLITNYVFITIVGLSVITSLLGLFVSNFINLGYRKNNKRNLDNGGKK